ncbi:MAG: type II secretion system protein M [Gammaproteobacteria bacterium]|nr:type II secretion system protein GspM [Gammaproteobacteria bacterium]MXW08064.1 type II secretion system protein M [Gammaproteobacteria bacterium]MYC26108.1 type II secretion system protein M [Gammaproteobacteria bacterium]
MTNKLALQFSESSIARWFRTLSSREQVLIYIVLVLLGIVLTLVLLTSVQNFRSDTVAAYHEKQADLDWMKANKDQAVLRAGMRRAGTQGDWRPIYRNAELHNIEIRSIERGSDGATIYIEAHPFQDILNWIFSLQDEAGMRVQQVNFNESDPGTVTTNLVLQ